MMPEVNLGKVVGPRGPQGPTGPEGPQGVQGPKGDPGAGVNPNLLMNWYFADPVNQRGKTEYSVSSQDRFTIDRWFLEGESPELSVQKGYITFKNGWFTQISGSPLDANRVMTCSVLTYEGDLLQVTFQGYGYHRFLDSSSREADMSAELNSINAIKLVCNLSAATHNLVAMKLEYGPVQTLAYQENGVWVLNEIPDPALELARCQRYYLRLSGQGSYISHSGNLIVARARGRDTAQLWIPTPTPMRATPVVRLHCALDFGEFDTILDVTAGSVIVGQNAVTCQVTGGEFDFDGVNTHYLHYADLCERGDYIELDAEL